MAHMKAMPWLRLFTETPADLKLRRVAKLANAPMAHVLAVWICMLCHAGSEAGDARGTLSGWDDGTIATGLDLEDEDVTRIRDAMQGRLLDGDVLVGWDKRQGGGAIEERPASSSAERMRRHRERKAGHAVTDVTDVTEVTRDVTPVTPPSASGDVSPPTSVTPVTAVADVTVLEERREEHIQRGGSSGIGEGVQGEMVPRADRAPQPSLPSLSAPKPKERRAFPSPAHYIPADWSPQQEDLAWALVRGVDGQAESENFRNHWLSDGTPRAKKRDWDAAFRVWISRCNRPLEGAAAFRQRGPMPPFPSAQERAASRHEETLGELDRFVNGDPGFVSDDPTTSGLGAGVVLDA